jgi:hypothetical protein
MTEKQNLRISQNKPAQFQNLEKLDFFSFAFFDLNFRLLTQYNISVHSSRNF